MFDTTEYKRDLSFYQTVGAVENLTFNQVAEDTNLQFGHQLLPNFIETPILLHTGRIASPSMVLEQELPSTDQFRVSTNLFAPWFYNGDSISYYNSTVPRSDLSYSQGTGNLLQLVASHSQNIASNWSFGLQYNRTKSHNLYFNNLPLFNQERMTNMFSTCVYSHFYTPNRKYEVMANFVNSKNTITETYGLTNPIPFDQLTGRAKTFSGEANFSGAQNLFIERTWNVAQFFRPGNRQVTVNDSTVVADTSTTSIQTQWFHQLKYGRYINRFTDEKPDTVLFPIRFVSLATNDSIFHSVLSNRIGKIQLISDGYYKFWAHHELVQVKQQFYHTSQFNNVRFAGEIDKSTEKIHQHLYGHVSGLGYNIGDYKVNYHIEKIGSQLPIGIEATIINRRPDYNDQFFGSNNYYWNQTLNKTFTGRIRTSISNAKKTNELSVEYRNINQHVYYDTNGYARQVDAGIQYLKAIGVSKLTFAKSWHIQQRLTYQYSSNSLMPVPNVSSKTRFYKEGYLFKKNMWARIGVDVQYFTPFAGRTYNPIVRQMTLTNTEIGGFPIVDFFINSQVKSMELYVSTHHIAQGYFINDSFLAGNYPLISRTFQFGINWRLFD